MSRTKNSLRNIAFGVGGQAVTMVLQFVTRSVFIQTLGVAYLGVTGLFTNILSVLALAELGVGSAITFNLYKPIADNDRERVCQYMQLYKKAYRVIGGAITLMGLALLPFLDAIVDASEAPPINIALIYLLFLMQTTASYFFYAYKRALLDANQKEYLVSLVALGTTVGSNLAQIIVLLTTKNYVAYVAVVAAFVILNNLAISFVCNRVYPYVNDKPKEKLGKEEVRTLIKNCSAIMIYKINGVVLNATDNIVLSLAKGVATVGYYANYHMIFAAINLFVSRVFTAVKASVGNLCASSEPEQKERVFMRVNFATFFLYATIAVGVAAMGNDFIKLWLGSDYCLTAWVPILIGVKLYLDGIKKLLYTFREAMGLFQQAKYRPLFSAAVNLSFSIVAVQYYGVCGILMGTIVADLTTYMWFDPWVIYKYGFKRSAKTYAVKNIAYFATFLGLVALNVWVLNRLGGAGFLAFVGKCALCVLMTTGAISLLCCKNADWAYWKNFATRKLRRKAPTA